MQIIRSQGNIVEKVLRDREGKLIRAKFFVYENGGRIKARLLEFVYLTELALASGVNFILSGFVKAKEIVNSFSNSKSFTSPFVILETIYFSGSKPRAPTLI